MLGRPANHILYDTHCSIEGCAAGEWDGHGELHVGAVSTAFSVSTTSVQGVFDSSYCSAKHLYKLHCYNIHMCLQREYKEARGLKVLADVYLAYPFCGQSMAAA